MPLHVYLEYTRAGLQAGRKKGQVCFTFQAFGVYTLVLSCVWLVLYILVIKTDTTFKCVIRYCIFGL